MEPAIGLISYFISQLIWNRFEAFDKFKKNKQKKNPTTM